MFKSNNKEIYIMYTIIFLIILTPYVRINSSISFRLEQIIIILFLFPLLFARDMKKILKENPFIFLFLIFSAFMGISIFVGYIKGFEIVLRDYYEFYKVFIYLGTFIMGKLIIKNDEDRVNVMNFILLCLILVSIIGFQQYFNLFNLNEKYIPLIAPNQSRTLINNYPTPRIIGMNSNPNLYALLPSLGILISQTLYFIKKEKVYLFIIPILFLSTLMTLSRSGIIFLIIGLFINMILFYKKNIDKHMKNNSKLKFYAKKVFILIGIITLIFLVLPHRFTWRLLRGINISTDSSFQGRLLNWKEHFEYFKMSPFFGIGPGKGIRFNSYPDNEWLLLLRRYGIIGTISLSLSFVVIILNSKKSYYKNFLISIFIGLVFYMIPGILYNSFEVMTFIMVLVSITRNKGENTFYSNYYNK